MKNLSRKRQRHLRAQRRDELDSGTAEPWKISE